MIQTVWLIAQDGMDRVLAQTTEPTKLQIELSKPTAIYKIEVDLPEVVKVDRIIRVRKPTPVDIVNQ